MPLFWALSALGVGGVALGYGAAKTTDKLFTYAVTGGALFIAYKMIKAK